jgi:nitric oxide reductase subunit B
VLLGIITAHYAVDGQGLYGIDIADYIPYVVTRTWHTQLSVFWIATACLATGLYVAPLISVHYPTLNLHTHNPDVQTKNLELNH